MAQTPPWRLGRHLTSVTVVGQTVAADGTFSAGTSYNLLAVIDSIDHQSRENVEEISAVNSTRINEVRLQTGHGVRLTTLKKSNGGDALAAIYANFSYARLTWIEGTETYDGYFRVGQFQGGVQGKGGQRNTLEFGPCDPNEAQLAWSTSA